MEKVKKTKKNKNKQYIIKPITLLIHDEDSVRFHVQQDDYFGTMATIISLLKQEIKKCPLEKREQINKTFKNLEHDLMFLQKNYQIKPKRNQKKRTPKGKLNNQ